MAGTVNKCKTSILASRPALPNTCGKESPDIPKTLTKLINSLFKNRKCLNIGLKKERKKKTKCNPLKADERI